jgi:hypothetical protein
MRGAAAVTELLDALRFEKIAKENDNTKTQENA